MANRFTFRISPPRVDLDTAFLSIRPVLSDNLALPPHFERSYVDDQSMDCPVYVYRIGQKEIHRFDISSPMFSLGWN